MCNAVGFCSFLLPIYTVCVNNSTHLVVQHWGLSTEDANTRQCFWLFPTCSYCLMMLQYPWHLHPLNQWLAVLSLSRIINLFTSLRMFNPNADLDTLYVTQAWKVNSLKCISDKYAQWKSSFSSFLCSYLFFILCDGNIVDSLLSW